MSPVDNTSLDWHCASIHLVRVAWISSETDHPMAYIDLEILLSRFSYKGQMCWHIFKWHPASLQNWTESSDSKSQFRDIPWQCWVRHQFQSPVYYFRVKQSPEYTNLISKANDTCPQTLQAVPAAYFPLVRKTIGSKALQQMVLGQ